MWRLRYAIAFLQSQLPIWFPSLADRGIIEIERAHRVYKKGENSSSKPRTLIFKLLRYNDRQAIMKAYRQAGTIAQRSQSHSQLMLFADYSNATVVKRKAFSSCIASLKQKGIPFFLLYPASLKVTFDSNNTRIFSSPEEAQRHIKDIWFQHLPLLRKHVIALVSDLTILCFECESNVIFNLDCNVCFSVILLVGSLLL